MISLFGRLSGIFAVEESPQIRVDTCPGCGAKVGPQSCVCGLDWSPQSNRIRMANAGARDWDGGSLGDLLESLARRLGVSIDDLASEGEKIACRNLDRTW